MTQKNKKQTTQTLKYRFITKNDALFQKIQHNDIRNVIKIWFHKEEPEYFKNQVCFDRRLIFSLRAEKPCRRIYPERVAAAKLRWHEGDWYLVVTENKTRYANFEAIGHDDSNSLTRHAFQQIEADLRRAKQDVRETLNEIQLF